MAGLDPAISAPHRDCRVKPGNDDDHWQDSSLIETALAARLLRGKAGATALLHLFGKPLHGVRGEKVPRVSRQRSLSRVYRSEYLRPGALAFLPKHHGFVARVLRPANPTRSNGMPNQLFLVGCRANFHHDEG